jgi:23S rRNA (cytosine1962-C5)-methyltransferase
MFTIQLQKGKEKAVYQGHPWLFSGAIKQVVGRPQSGDVVRVADYQDQFLAYGYYHRTSRVAVRLLEWKEDHLPDETWLRNRIRQAVSARLPIVSDGSTTACRLIFAEADWLPGLIVDQYGEYLSMQIHSAGMEISKKVIIDELVQLVNPKGIYERSDLKSRAHEELEDTNGLLWGVEPPEFVDITENGIHYQVNIIDGQKSGFYCDQRENRRITAQYSKGKRVLDCFCYSGGFTLNALQAGASHVTSVDSSALAIETLHRNAVLNSIETSRFQTIQSDVSSQLKQFIEAGERFDLIVLDPPKYAPTRSSLDKAVRAYKDLNRRALLLLESGGILATFSCSGAMDIILFKQVLAWAAMDAGKEIQFIGQFVQPEDHPVRASFEEGEYLKGLLCRVMS